MVSCSFNRKPRRTDAPTPIPLFPVSMEAVYIFEDNRYLRVISLVSQHSGRSAGQLFGAFF